MPREFGGKWRTECFNNRFPGSFFLLLCMGYSVNLKNINNNDIRLDYTTMFGLFKDVWCL